VSLFRYLIVATSFVAMLAFIPAAASTPTAPPDSWPQILHDGAHSSVSADTQLSTTTASKLGVNWMSSMRAADLGGPVSAFSTVLGNQMAYVGDERGDVIAYNETNGTTVWSTSLGFNDVIRSTPMVAPDGSVWAATGLDPTIYKLDGSTGKVLCSLKAQLLIESSIMFATPPGGVPTAYTATVDGSNTIYGKLLAIRESDCKPTWAFDNWRNPAGAWDTPAFGVDSKGNGLVVIGTNNPDEEMYAVNALTGKLDWYYSAYVQGDFDIGAAPTISPPGNNGFAGGVVYFHSKYGILYAVDLTTGKGIWQYNYDKAAHLGEGGISSVALYKSMLVYGVANGIEAVDALTGQLLWHYTKAHDVVSSPAIVGPSGKEIIVFGDANGRFIVLRLADGAQLYSYQAGNYFTSSPAIVNGHVLIASSDSFLYDFAVGGGNVPLPTTAIASPRSGANVRNPGATLTVSGTATDSSGGGVTELQVSIQAGGPAGPWYDAARGTWTTGAYNNFVAVEHPVKHSSKWSFSFPVTPEGSTYQVTANTVDLSGQVDRIGAQSSFAVLPSRSEPHLTLSTALVAPGSTFTAFGRTFGPSETVDFTLQGSAVGKGTSTPSGFVPKVTIAVPSTLGFGPSTLTATGETSQKTTTAPVDITNLWTQSGDGPTHTGYELNDSVLKDSVEATHNGYLSRAWLYMTGAPVAASPAIVGGYAFVANTSGTIAAVDTVSGAPFWTYTIPSKAAIHAAPAVGNGDVVFGADDNTIYRLAKSTGAPIGTETLDGIPTSPALAGGTIYVGTTNGTVYAIDEATGTQRWSTPIGAAIHYSPAVDLAGGALIVGDDAGNVTTLNPSTGALLRQTSTGGAGVTVSPAVSSGSVLVGSSDGMLRAFKETTDALEWTYAAGAPIHALATTGIAAYVGTSAGNVSKVDQKTGKRAFLAMRGSAITGIAHSLDISVDEAASGVVTLGKDSQEDERQFDYKTGAGLSTQPAIVDGTVYVTAGDGGLYAFTSHGQAPEDAIEHAFLLQLEKSAPIPERWPALRAPRVRAPRPH
jgi:outer membrane protein assembly factor BamB